MSTVRLEHPSRVLLGDLRLRLMAARVVIAWLPFLGAVMFTLLWFVGLLPQGVVGAGLIVGSSIELVTRLQFGRSWWATTVSSAWWRSRWWSDARASGLCAIADPSVNAESEKGGRMAKGIELAPRVLSLRCRRHTRTYVVKALPGQMFEDFEDAVPALAYRWGAEVAVTAHPRRRRVVLLEVVSRDALAETVRHPVR